VDLALVVALAVTTTLLAVTCGLLVVVLSAARRTRRDLDVSRSEVERLAARVERMERDATQRPVVPETGYLITDAGTRRPEEPAGTDEVRTRVVLSAGLAEPVVKVLAFGYGVHRALSPQNRNRIRFEMAREIRRARKLRRRTARRAQRQATSRARAAGSQAVT
jgi:hypothetical protein